MGNLIDTAITMWAVGFWIEQAGRLVYMAY